jgi:CheY-like chemotaxis protein
MTSVLIVDHESDCASRLAEELFAIGFSTRSARSGQEALAVTSGFVPDVAFIRLAMPGLNGFELARQLELDPALSKCRFVAMTVHDCPEFEQCAKVVQFVRILKAPVESDLLRATIAELLEAA